MFKENLNTLYNLLFFKRNTIYYRFIQTIYGIVIWTAIIFIMYSLIQILSN